MSENRDTPTCGGSGRRDHDLRRPLHDALSAHLAGDADPAALAETVLRTLDEHRVIQYAPRETLAILTPAGRVLVLLCEQPDVTLRQMSRVLGTTESSVARTVSKLAKSNVITRTKVAGRNVYALNVDVARTHPDLRRYHDAVLALLGDAPPLEGC